MTHQARYYLFPRDAYFVPSLSRLVDLLEVMDREMELGLQAGGLFQGFVRMRRPEEATTAEQPSERILDATSFEDFRARSGKVSGEPKEIQLQLGRPGREPLRSHDLGTKNVEVQGFANLRMIDVGDVEPARLSCPSCGQQGPIDASFSVRPDPRYYCGHCGGLTPLPETRLAMAVMEEEIPFPCYRFAMLLDAEGEASPASSVSVSAPSVAGIGAFEGALGCGLRAVLVRSPARTKP